ncbi:FKBP-type peptidyl-prolyl cis-trans isomerase [uncultured Sphingomonas sp.]|uniref:FKBP-type peptidyl-prolyl cis-trans isomerase n=1 Tax=uncultured Sphingomonas sp. TaxID=158754 RepID=UPI0035CBE349
MSTVTAVPILPIKRGYLVWLWVGVVAVILAAAALARAAPVDPAAAFLAGNRGAAGVMETPSGLQYKVLRPGTGTPPTDSDVALVMYDGTLVDGTRFDKSTQPLVAALGEQATVPGFEEALKLMPRGSKYRVWIKPSLGYGPEEKRDPTGRVVIPANSVLVFDLDMLDYRSKIELQQMQAQRQMGAVPPAGATGAPPSDAITH